MELVLEISGDQIDGARDYQEDAFLVSFLDDEASSSRSSALVIMADGMGGHAAGNIASNLVVSTFNKTFTGGFGKSDTPVLLRQALEKSNDALAESIKETPGLDGMGCTMVTGVFSRGKAWWISVGDSHFYLIRDGQLQKKNEDHSYGGYLDRMRAQGMEVEAEPGLSRNMLMSAMTGDPVAEIDCPNKPLQLLAGDRVIVCSDGLDTLSDAAILQTCAWANSARECVAALLKAVEDARKPRQDNTTVIVVDVSGRDEPRARPPAGGAGVPADNEDTQQLSVSDLHDALDVSAVTPAIPTAQRTVVPPAPRPPASNLGRILGLVAAVLIAAGAGAWYFLSQDELPPPRAPSERSTGTETRVPGSAGEGDGGGQDTNGVSTDTRVSGAGDGAQATTGGETGQGLPSVLLPDAGSGENSTDGLGQAAEPFRDPLQSGGEGPSMVPLAAGTFTMGATGFSGSPSEGPRHEVKVPAFAIGQHEVTIEEYAPFARATGRTVPSNRIAGDKAPAVGMSWDDALAYTRWLSTQTGKRYRLPSEAEWEYAARAGENKPYPWGFEPGSGNAHCFDCQAGFDQRAATAVGRFAPNGFGLHDTAGNVREWVHDCFHGNYTGAPDDGSVWEGGDCSQRVVRGGSFSTTSGSIRSGARARWAQKKGANDIGIRVVRELD